MNNEKIKRYLLTIIVQILTVTIHTVCSFCALKLEAVALAPVRYILPIGMVLICLDAVCELIIFRGIFKKNNSEVAQDE